MSSPNAVAIKTESKRRKPAAKKKTTPTVVVIPTHAPTHAEIAALAEAYWAERGRHDGFAEQDWLRAEQELIGRAS